MSRKRRAESNSDSETEERPENTASASKRARTVGFDSDPEIRYIPKTNGKSKEQPKGKGKAKARQVDDEDSDDELVNDAEFDEEAEKKFEEAHTDLVRAAIDAKRQLHGGIAEYGIIESIEMVQFMCHKYLTFKFGEQINFIIGRNGSGKSAVLSAITVALGGKSSSTGRGTGLKSFIREGQASAEVTIQLKNQGDEAFKPKEYGKSIFITRRFNKEGLSFWKIKSHDGKVISSKKDELSAICDHMNIQIDNPMNVLTQDAARQFLSTSQPGDKYKFFLRGTQLSQLSDEYDTCLENISQTTKALQQKKEAIPDLKAAFKEATARYDEASKAREQKKKADELKKELAWAHVAAKEDELRKKLEEVAKATRRLPKYDENINTAQVAFDNASAEIARLEAEHNEVGDIEHLSARKKALQEEMRVNKKKIAEFTDDMRRMDASIKGTRKAIEDYQHRIDDETAKMAVQTQAKREETSHKLLQAKQDIQDADQHLKDIIEQRRQKTIEADSLKAKGQQLEPTIQAAKNRIVEIQETLSRCVHAEKDNYVAYGHDIQKVLQEIQKMKWKGEVIGPLGLHVKVKEPEKWGNLLRSQLGGHMTSFAVTNSSDQKQLKALLLKYKNPHVAIVIGQRDMFDFSQGEPPKNEPTVLRALEIDDPWVLRILVNAARIERIYLAPTRIQGQQLLSKIQGGGNAWTADMFRVTIFPDGGRASTLLYHLQAKDPKQFLFPQRDAAGERQRWNEELAKAEQELKTTQQESSRLQQEYNALRREIDGLTRKEKQAHERLRIAKTMRDALQEEANSELPVEIASIDAAKADAEREKESIMSQFKALMQKKSEVDEVQKPLQTQLNQVKDQINDFEGQRAAITTKVEEAVQKRMQAQNDKNHYQKKKDEDEDKVKALQRVADGLQVEFEDWTNKASEFCTRYPEPRAVNVVQRNLDSVQRALQERERRHGATVEEMAIEVNKTKANLENAQGDLIEMSQLNKALKSSLIIRLARWQEFRRHIALRCKLVFAYHLSQRGYYGKVLFDHGAGTLQLKVRTDDQRGTQSREKDPRSLSGGEKSFATICLLLSLWDSIGCPLRCLDEFDVFMDAVNRRISMKLMIDTANASDKKQYILITPLDMNNVTIGPTIRVNKMPDPERGQGILAFGN